MTREFKLQNGDTEYDNSEGQFADNHFTGYGEKYIKRINGTEQYTLEATYVADANEGGKGKIDYPNGDRFSGTVGNWNQPIQGYCTFTSIEFSGECHSHSTKTSKDSGIVCMVAVGATNKCLKRIGGWIDD